MLTSREWFQDWKDQLEVRGLTDIQRAARYYYIQRLAFGGKVKHRSYGVQIDRAIPRINILRIEEEMSTVHLRLAHVRIENLTWQNLIKRYDKPDTFFYCDPPYYKAPEYKHNLDLPDYIEMSTILSGINGQFILSINDRPEMREIFKIFKIQPVSLLYTVSKKPTKAKELIITN
ncbi:MAG: DNA adenine methylase [Desulfobacteraceae bacterium]|nr:DNA adenine methylase [Desulfobacteraceae bacterium]